MTSSRKIQILNEVYKNHSGKTWRKEFDIIIDMVESNSTVLDLGCGDGSLGEELMKRKKCKVFGIDISEVAVKHARRKGINARVGNLEEPLDFEDNSFEYVILCDVLEHLFDPLFTLKEAFRVSKKYVIVAFPNFAYFKSRLELLFFGIFPKSPLFGYDWYNSQHIRLFSYKDFLKALKDLNFNVRIVRRGYISNNIIPKFFLRIASNLLAGVCVLKLEKYLFNYERVIQYKFDV